MTASSSELVVGATRIPYVVRHSERSRRKRIVVTPDGVEVVVPAGSPAADIDRFMHDKRRWVFLTVSDMAEHLATRAQSAGASTSSAEASTWANGAKVVWRGRRLTLRVALAEVEQPQVVFRSRFDVRLPLHTPDDARAALVQAAVEAWMQQRAHAEAKTLVARYAVQAGVQVRRVEVRPMLRLWGSCGRDGVIRLDTGFMRLPAELGAYLCAHEVVHLVHRDHSAAFWRVLRTLVPDARRRHEALMAHGRTL